MNVGRELTAAIAWLVFYVLLFALSAAMLAGLLVAAGYLIHVGWNAA